MWKLKIGQLKLDNFFLVNPSMLLMMGFTFGYKMTNWVSNSQGDIHLILSFLISLALFSTPHVNQVRPEDAVLDHT